MIHVPTNPHLHIVFDLIAWISAAVAGWRVKQLHPDQITRLEKMTDASYFISLAVGALVGAWLLGSLNSLRWSNPTLSHSVGGALAGGILAVEMWKWRKGVTVSTGASFVLPLSVGIMIGRFGCFFSGIADHTYGLPSTLPWAVDIGDGITRHPVQLYEAIAMAAFLLIFPARLKPETAFYGFVGFYATQRFIWEFLKPYPLVILGLNTFHFMMLGLIAYAFIYTRNAHHRNIARTQSRPLHIPQSNIEPM